MKELTLDQTVYKISPIPQYLLYYTDYIAELTKRKVSSVEDAEQLATEHQQCLTRILEETVQPKAATEHTTELYNAVIDATNEVMERAHFFRKQQCPKKGNTVSPNTS